MDIEVIKSEEEYEAVLTRISQLFFAEPGTSEEEELEALIELAQAYERETCDMSLPDPIEAIEYYKETRGLSTEDLAEYMGSPSIVSAVLNREHPVTSEMADRLEEGLGIPSRLLMQPYESYADVAQEEDRHCEVHWSSGQLNAYRRFDFGSEEEDLPSYGEEERQQVERSRSPYWTSRTAAAFACV